MSRPALHPGESRGRHGELSAAFASVRDAPADDRAALRAAADLIDAGEPFVLVTVVKTRGSTPRNAGARMIWRPERDSAGLGLPNGASGTVGGGQFEHLVIDAARACFERRTHMHEEFVLGADADQCCGGTMEVFLEYHGRPARVVIFGAGHVAHALAPLLVPSGIEVVVVDDRAEWASGERYPGARCITTWDTGVMVARERAESTLAVVMTCSHDTDFELLRRLLAPGRTDAAGVAPAIAPPAPPRFVGLIGSRSKRVCLFGRLVAAGVDEQAVSRVQCPVGVGDTGKEPHAVAVSIAAQLLMEARKLVHAA